MTKCEGRARDHDGRGEHPPIWHEEFYCPMCVLLDDYDPNATPVWKLEGQIANLQESLASAESSLDTQEDHFREEMAGLESHITELTQQIEELKETITVIEDQRDTAWAELQTMGV